MRAIDADAFDERVRVAGGMSEEELTEDFKDGVQAVLYMLSNQPTIQPEPKRGRWVLVCDNNGMHFICSKCGAWRYHQEQKFCGECGADMREVNHESN